MQEALILFESIVNSPFFERAAVILLLNKNDILKTKLAAGSEKLTRYYPDYTGPPGDLKATQTFFASKFRNLVRNPNKETYIHYTTATDTDLLKKTMDSVQDMIVQRNLKYLIFWFL